MTLNESIMSLELGLIYGIVAMGIYLTLRIIDFSDLTCDGSFVLGSAVSSVILQQGGNPWLSLIFAAFSGSIAGGFTGLLSTKLNLTPLLASILVGFMLYSINLRIMGGIPNIMLENSLLGQHPLLPLTVISLMIGIGLSYLLVTDLGLALRSIGQNKKLSQSSGIHVHTMTIMGLSLSNALIALGGALISHHQGFADIGSGIGTIIAGLTSVIIGEKLLPFSSPSAKVLSCIAGSIAYRLIMSCALHTDVLGLTSSDFNLITGLMVIAMMLLPKRQGESHALA